MDSGTQSSAPFRQRNSYPALGTEGAMKPLPALHEVHGDEDLELERLSQLCLPRWELRERWRETSRAVRPERPEFSAMMRKPPSQAWDRALRQIQEGALRGRPLDMAFENYRTSLHKSVLQAISVILYDKQTQQNHQHGLIDIAASEQILSKEEAEEKYPILLKRMKLAKEFSWHIADFISPVFEHMLLVDYGMEAPPLLDNGSKNSPNKLWKRLWPVWNDVCSAMSEFAECCTRAPPNLSLMRSVKQCIEYFPDLTWGYLMSGAFYEYDLALMMHHYHTHRISLEVYEYMDGYTGYQGVLQEMMDEVSTNGTERLSRKLSVDVNENIEIFVKDKGKRKAMIEKAQNIASRYDICLYAPKVYGMGKPLLELHYKDGMRREPKTG